MNKSYHNKNDVSSSGFEDSEGETIEPNEEPQQSGDVLEKLLTSRGYKGLKVQKKINSPQIDSDEEEVYLLRIPKSIDPKVLESSKFSLSKESKVKTASGKYYMKPLADVPEPKLFLNSNGLKKISPISMFQLEKFVETQDKEKETIEENEIQPTPSNLIPRHTIFGAKYVERINLQEQIQQKLQEALQRFEKKNKVSKHKKKPIVNTEDFDDKSLLISQILEAKFNDKRLSTSDNSGEISKKKNDNYATSMNITPTAINIKQDYSEDSNYQCQTSSGKKKKKNKYGENISVEIKKEILSEAEMPVIDSMEKKKKKKRRNSVVDGTDNFNETNKRKRDDSISDVKHLHSELIIKQDFSDDLNNSLSQTSPVKKKKKKKDGGNISIDTKKEILSEVEMTEIGSIKKKKRRESVVDGTDNFNQANKRKRDESFSDINNLHSELIIKEDYSDNSNNSQSQTSPVKKKKKNKDRGNISIDIKKEIFSEPEIQESDTGEKKKKKKRRDSIAFATPESIKQEVDECMLPPPKRRKPSILSSTVIKEGTPDFQFDVSVIESDKVKKKSKSK